MKKTVLTPEPSRWPHAKTDNRHGDLCYCRICDAARLVLIAKTNLKSEREQLRYYARCVRRERKVGKPSFCNVRTLADNQARVVRLKESNLAQLLRAKRNIGMEFKRSRPCS